VKWPSRVAPRDSLRKACGIIQPAAGACVGSEWMMGKPEVTFLQIFPPSAWMMLRIPSGAGGKIAMWALHLQ
jgi:hypothetical protein